MVGALIKNLPNGTALHCLSNFLHDDTEICYNFRYPAKTDRKNKGSPWSMRHLAIYQHYRREINASKWVLVQPSHGLRAQMVKYLNSTLCQSRLKYLHSANLHCMCLMSAEQGWREYLNYEQTGLTSLVTCVTPPSQTFLLLPFKNPNERSRNRNKRPIFPELEENHRTYAHWKTRISSPNSLITRTSNDSRRRFSKPAHISTHA